METCDYDLGEYEKSVMASRKSREAQPGDPCIDADETFGRITVNAT